MIPDRQSGTENIWERSLNEPHVTVGISIYEPEIASGVRQL